MQFAIMDLRQVDGAVKLVVLDIYATEAEGRAAYAEYAKVHGNMNFAVLGRIGDEPQDFTCGQCGQTVRVSAPSGKVEKGHAFTSMDPNVLILASPAIGVSL